MSNAAHHTGPVDQSTLRPSDRSEHLGAADGERIPGVALVFSNGAPSAIAMPLVDGLLELGRGRTTEGKVEDLLVSRRHACVRFDGHRFTVSDLGSQNGTFADGEPVPPQGVAEVERVIRIGEALLVPLADVRPLRHRGVRTLNGFIRGPAMQAVVDQLASVSRAGSVVHIHGESGTGKEGLAHAFHRASGEASRPLVAVNCATVPQNLAERLLFGAKRGAYSGAEVDAAGYIQEADGGTLFLDEVAELDLAVQAKLLRTIESKEVVALGAVRGRRVDFRLCSATNRDLRAYVAAGKLREDLYFRIGRPAVSVPPLRDRPEEIAYLVVEELQRAASSLLPHVSFVEQCLLRPWPGNVRELLAETRSAAQAANSDGAQRLGARHLAPVAGLPFATESASPMEVPKCRQKVDKDFRRRIEDTLRANGRNVSASARALGLHRTQLRRLLERHGISVEDAADHPAEDDALGRGIGPRKA